MYCLQEHRHDSKNILSFNNVMGKKSVNFSCSNMYFYLFIYFILLFYFILFYFILFCFILFYFILFYFVLFCFVLFYFILFYFILFYFILFYFILFYFIHIPWIIGDKSHLDIGIVNMEMDATR